MRHLVICLVVLLMTAGVDIATTHGAKIAQAGSSLATVMATALLVDYLPLPPSGHFYHGVYPGGQTGNEDDITAKDVQSYVTAAGKSVTWVYFSNNWYANRAFPLETATWIRELRSNTDADHADPTYSPDRIVKGDFDSDLRLWMQGAHAFGSPLLVEYGTEVNGKWFAWNGFWYGGQTPTGPATFREAYRHIIRIAGEEGVTHIMWVFHINAVDNPQETWNKLENYYPGDEWIDWLGVSDYGATTPMEQDVSSFRTLMDGVYPRLTALAPDKPIVVVEFGTSANNPNTDQATWADAALTDLLSSRWPKIIGFSWWNEKWTNDDNPAHNTTMRLQDNPYLASVFQEKVGHNENVLGEIQQPSIAFA